MKDNMFLVMMVHWEPIPAQYTTKSNSTYNALFLNCFFFTIQVGRILVKLPWSYPESGCTGIGVRINQQDSYRFAYLFHQD